METIVIMIMLILIPIKYILLSFSMEKPRSLDDYHIASHKIEPINFIDSSVAYSLQIAALTLFATWGYQYGIWVIWVPIFWMLGYILLGFLIKNGSLDDIILSNETSTIHEFIGNRLSYPLTYVASLISLIAIIGTAMYEADFAASFSTEILFKSANYNATEQEIYNLKTLLFASIIFVTAGYMIIAGFRAVVVTDTFQLFLGFVSFSCVISMLAVKTSINGFLLQSSILLVLAILLILILSFYWHKQDIQGSIKIASYRFNLVFLISFFVLIVGFLFCLINGYNDYNKKIPNLFQFYSPFSLGFKLLLNLFIANVFYQLVDVGQYQRLISVKTNHNEIEITRKILANANITVGLYSSFSWIMAIIFGILLKLYFFNVEVDAYSIVIALAVSLLNSNFFDFVIIICLLTTVLSLAFSTLDSYVSGISFTIDSDIASKLINTKSLLRPRITTGFLVFIGFILISYLFPYLKQKYGVNYAAEFLYLCWSFQIALLPLIICSLFRIRLTGFEYFIMLLSGIIGAFVPFFKDVYSVYELSASMAAISSMLFFVTFIFIRKTLIFLRGIKL